MARARECGERGDWRAAVALLTPLEARLAADDLLLLARGCEETGEATRAAEVLQRGVGRFSQDESLWLALVDHALERRQGGLALDRISAARRQLGMSAQIEFRAAQAYYLLGHMLGRTKVRRVPDGRAGQFHRGWLLVELRVAPDRFLCAPRESALYALRQALDAGLDEPAAHCLHARIWQRAGRPDVGLTILRSREAAWLENPTDETLATLADVALAAGAFEGFLRYARRRADLRPELRARILGDAYLAVAERYNERGDDAMYRAFLRRTLDLRPEDSELMLRLADSTWEAGAHDDAAVLYRKVLEREASHPERRRILRRLGE